MCVAIYISCVQVIKETGATSIKDMKLVMPKLSQKIQGKADPSLVGEVVRKLLQKQ